MIKRFLPLVAACCVLAGCSDEIVSTASQESASKIGDQGGRPFMVTLSGDAEVHEADPDGSGVAHITLNQGQGAVCYHIMVADIVQPTAAHIHKAPAGVNGGVVVPLMPVTGMEWSGCTEEVDPELIKDIRQHPSEYYVNVHNAVYPPGAIRGQLSK